MIASAHPGLPRDRLLAALQFRAPGVIPVEYHSSPAGFHEHGRRLRDLWLQYPDDFGPPGRFPTCQPPPECVDGDGRYFEIRRDEWGVTWKHLIFGASGVPVEQPLADWSALDTFEPPAPPSIAGLEFCRERARAGHHRRKYFLKSGWVSLFELMHALRRYEDVLMDIATDRPEIHHLADMLTEYHAACIGYLIARGVDAIQFGDDFGTQSELMLSPTLWRRFFKPRYAYLMELVRRAGKKVFFHSCGRIRRLFDDLTELRVDALWPQLGVYEERDLARFCRDAGIALALHPDRGSVMIESSPAQVRRYMEHLAEAFEADRGGAWFYLEVDHGFPFENVVAATEAIARLRGMA